MHEQILMPYVLLAENMPAKLDKSLIHFCWVVKKDDDDRISICPVGSSTTSADDSTPPKYLIPINVTSKNPTDAPLDFTALTIHSAEGKFPVNIAFLSWDDSFEGVKDCRIVSRTDTTVHEKQSAGL